METVENRVAHVAELIERSKAARLYGLEWLLSLGIETVCREYNGIGPEWAGPDVRAWVTAHIGLFEPAAMVHDLRNFSGDGSRLGFDFANAEFLMNCRRLADAAYPWWSWRRYRARAAAFLLFSFVDGPGGWVAWRQASENRDILSRQGLRQDIPSFDRSCYASKATGTAGPLTNQQTRKETEQ